MTYAFLVLDEELKADQGDTIELNYNFARDEWSLKINGVEIKVSNGQMS